MLENILLQVSVERGNFTTASIFFIKIPIISISQYIFQYQFLVWKNINFEDICEQFARRLFSGVSDRLHYVICSHRREVGDTQRWDITLEELLQKKTKCCTKTLGEIHIFLISRFALVLCAVYLVILKF